MAREPLPLVPTKKTMFSRKMRLWEVDCQLVWSVYFSGGWRRLAQIYFKNRDPNFPLWNPFLIDGVLFVTKSTVRTEIKCNGESQILHELVHETTRKSESQELIRKVSRTKSCIISVFSLHFNLFSKSEILLQNPQFKGLKFKGSHHRRKRQGP